MEFETLLEGVESDDDKTLLTDWFVRDDNIVPPVYQLTPIRQKLPDYANDEDPELKKKVMDFIYKFLHQFIPFLNSSPSAAYMRQWTGPA